MVNLGRLLVVFALFLNVTNLSAQQPDSTFWVPNGPVNSLLIHDSTIIIGGNFDQIAPITGSFVRVDTSSGLPDPSLFKTNGAVYAMCKDSVGHIYVGGSFTRVGNTSVDHLFRLTPSGNYDPTFHCSVNGTVYALYFDSLLYIGGDFTYVENESRNNFCSFNVDSGGITPFDPNVNGPVYCMEPDSFFNCMIIGGDFTQVGQFSPPYLAKVDMNTGVCFTFNAVPWSVVPNADAPVYAMKRVYNRLYIAGEFRNFATIYRPGLAKMDVYYGGLTTADPQVNGSVYDLELIDSMLYIGGNFTMVASQSRTNLACLRYSDFAVQPWNPVPNGEVRALERIDSLHMFVGGDFTSMNGDTCIRGAIISNELDSVGTVKQWNPAFNALVCATITDATGRLYAGGEFYAMGGKFRNSLCAVSMNSGQATSWNPNPNNEVYSMTLDGDSLYFAGAFTLVSGISRGKVAAIDLNTETLLPFNPTTNGVIRTIVVTDSLVYAGGNFTMFGGAGRNNIGKVSKSTGLAINWNANCLGTVNSILVTPQWIYVAGFFSTIGGQTRDNIARVHPTLATADLNWICNTDDGVYHAEFYNGKLAVTGWFDQVNGQSSPDFALIDTTSLVTAPVNFNCDLFARTFTTYGDDFFISGAWDVINAQYQPRLVAYDEGNAAIDPWTPIPDQMPITMVATATRLFIGGAMQTTGGRFQPNFQVLSVQWVTTIDEHDAVQSGIPVYPNPTSDKIVANGVEDYSNYTVTDITGNVIMNGTISSSTLEISLGELPAGVYFLNLSGEGSAPVSQRLIKE